MALLPKKMKIINSFNLTDEYWSMALSQFLILFFAMTLLMGCQDSTSSKSQANSQPRSNSDASNHTSNTSVHPKKSNKEYEELTHSDSLVPLENFFSKDTQAYAFMQPSLKPLKAGGGVAAQNCRLCHTKIYGEWKQTTHAWALHDLQFLAELTKTGSPKWLCLNCHIPNQDQREYKITGLDKGNVLKPVIQPNPNFNQALQQEAINCAACHLRQNQQGETVVLGGIGNTSAPHPVKHDPQALRNTCLRCHDPKGQSITPNLICWFKTQDELKSNPGPSVRKQDCVSCHMPTRTGPIVNGGPNRLRHLHHWVGGGIPKMTQGFDSLKSRGYKSGLKLKSIIEGDQLKLGLTNIAGHALPSADPERYYRIEVIQKSSDQIIGDSIVRIGQVWQWSPAQKLGDTRLMGGEKKNIQFRILNNVHSIEVIVSHHRLSVENMLHMKQAPVDEDLYPGALAKIKEMEKNYPRMRFTHKVSYSRDPALGAVVVNPGDWVKEKFTFEMLNQLSIEKNQTLDPHY